ncbi:unnamed protein product, partial [Musa textilis]
GEEEAGGGGGGEAGGGEAAVQQGEGLQVQEELLQQGGGRHLLRHPPLSLRRLCSSLPRSIHPLLPLTSLLRQLHPAGKRMALKDFVPAGGGGNVSVREADDKEKAKGKPAVPGRRARSSGVLLMMPRLVDLSPFTSTNNSHNLFNTHLCFPYFLLFDPSKIHLENTNSEKPLSLPEAHSSSYNNNDKVY